MTLLMLKFLPVQHLGYWLYDDDHWHVDFDHAAFVCDPGVVIKWQVLTLFIIKTITMSDFLSWDTDLDLDLLLVYSLKFGKTQAKTHTTIYLVTFKL
jgi:hypothetical protein